MSDTAEELLNSADILLAGRTTVPRSRQVRAAAWLTRAAIESLIVRWLAAHGIDASRATTKTQLACLRVLDPDRGRAAASVWLSLSRCCHHHAYELEPAGYEVRELLNRVRRASVLPDQAVPHIRPAADDDEGVGSKSQRV